MVWIARPVMLCAAAALLAACQGARPGEGATPAIAGPVQLLHHHNEGPAAQAVVSGVLRLDDRGCLRLGERALIWPEQTALDLSQPGVVRVFHPADPESVQVGQPVAVLAAAPAKAPASACPGGQLAVARFAPAG